MGKVVGMPLPSRPQITPLEITRASGAAWLEGIAQADSLRYDAPTESNMQGSPYRHSLQGFVPNSSPEMQRIVAAMNGRRFLVAFQDKNQRWRLLGNSNQLGARFFCNMQITNNADGTSGFSFSFSLTSTELLPELLTHPVDDVQVFAIQNNYELITYASARASIDKLLRTP